jgi:Winged helix DNA-binding domain
VAPAYLRAYGPATIERFDAWLTRSTSRKGALRSWLAALGDDLVTADVEGTSAYLLAEDVDELAGTAPTAAVRLLPAFDQYVLGPGTAATEILDRDRRAEVSRAAGWISPVVVAAGRVAGLWDRDGREIDVRLFDDADGGDGDSGPPAGALDAAIERMRDVVSALDSG